MEPVITVIIPTYRRPDLLSNCLNCLARQELAKAQFVVIVVDDGNESAICELTRAIALKTGLTIEYVGQQHRRGPAAARNAGWRSARTPFIAFTDDDCLPQPTWLTAALTRFDQGAHVLTGRVSMPMPECPTLHDRTTALLETAEFVTANLFCRRAVLEQVGGFEERFDIAWREDSDLQFKLLQAGIPILACPEAVIVHPIRKTPWYASLRDERKNRYDALLFKRHPALFRQRIPAYRWLVIRYYASVIGFTTGLLATGTGDRPAAIIGFGVWAALTAMLMQERLTSQPLTWHSFKSALLTSLATPFLSVYWRLYGAFKYRVLYW